MNDGSHSESLLELVTAGVGVDEAAQRLIEHGTQVEVLSLVEEFLHALDADPTARDRALLLIERTRLLAERGAEGAQRSDGLRADAAAFRTADAGTALDATSGVLHHELSTPITVARTALEHLAAHDDDPATVEQMVDIALRSLRFASRLLESLGRAEHLRTGRAELSWTQVDLAGLVRECVTDVRAVLVGRHEFSVTAERTVRVPADPDAVRQIMFNLLTNAAKFSPEGSPIEVTVTATADHADVVVRDRGPGIPERDVARIFEARQRLDVTAPGRGLGLFIARRLARAHGGDLSVEDASEGSRFVLRVPANAAEWQQSLERREGAATSHDARRRERDAVADARDAELNGREAVAAQRDSALDSREALAHERDAGFERRDQT